jgi:electron transport complex protein RnfE
MKEQEAVRGGVARENPAVVLLLGLCPAAVVSVRVIDSLWMSLGVVAVMHLSSLCMWMIARGKKGEGREIRPAASTGRWLAALVLSSCLTACFEIVLLAVAPEASAGLGIYVPLIAVNCCVLTVIHESASAPSPARLLLETAGNGARFAACLVALGLAREALGAGTITLFPLPGFSGTFVLGALSHDPARALSFAGGGLLCLGYLAALLRAVKERRQ